MTPFSEQVITSSIASGSVVDMRVRLKNSSLVRIHGIINWTRLRIGFRLQMDRGYGYSLSTPQFQHYLQVGLCNYVNDDTGSVGQRYVKHQTSLYNSGFTFNFNEPTSTTFANYNSNANAIITRDIENVGFYQQPSLVVGANQFGTEPSESSRKLYFVDIISGSGNTLTQKLFYCNSDAKVAEPTDVDFRTQMSASTPSFVGHVWSPESDPYSDTEDSGSLNAAYVFWSSTFARMYISDFAVVKIA